MRAVIPLGVADKVEGRGRRARPLRGLDGRRPGGRATHATPPPRPVPGGRRFHGRASCAPSTSSCRPPTWPSWRATRRWWRSSADALPTPNDERTAQIVAGNLASPAFTAPSGPGYLAWHDARFPGRLRRRRSTSPTPASTTAAVTPEHPDFHELGSSSDPGRVDYQADYTSPAHGSISTPTRATAAATAPTSPRSRPATTTRPGRENQDAAGFNYGLGIAPLARIGVVEDLQLRTATARPARSPTTPSPRSRASPIGERLRRRRPHLEQLVGRRRRCRLGRVHARAARSSTSSCATPSRGPPVTSRWSRSSQPATTAPIGRDSIHAEGTRQERDHRRAHPRGARDRRATAAATPDASADNARDIVDFSSRGPTDDGRLKPDLVAPGTHVTGARPPTARLYNGSGTCNPVFAGTLAYSLVSGTSQAAPAGLGRRGAGSRLVRRDNEGGPALARADQGAADQHRHRPRRRPPGHDANATHQGWGRVNLGAVFDSTARELYDQQPADLLDDAGQTVVQAYTCRPTAQPVQGDAGVDRPAGPDRPETPSSTTSTSRSRRRRETYRGNVFGGSLSRTGGAADSRNNVESVVPAGRARGGSP